MKDTKNHEKVMEAKIRNITSSFSENPEYTQKIEGLLEKVRVYWNDHKLQQWQTRILSFESSYV